MRINGFDTCLVNSGLRNYLFVTLTTDDGLTGVGEASLEWQETAVAAILHDWVEVRIIGEDPFDIERVLGGMIRDQYQGGPTVLTAISAVEVAMWDIVGKACGQPVYKLLGGRCRDRLPAYANGWYGGLSQPEQYAERAKEVVSRGYGAMKFDPFGTAWQTMTRKEMDRADAIVGAVRRAVGGDVELLIEAHGRLSVGTAIEMGRGLQQYRIGWYEEPVAPGSLDLLKEVKDALGIPIAAGERIYTLGEFSTLTHMRAVDIIQMDPAHCGGLAISKKISAMAESRDISVSPHCSIGPVALCAAIHLGWLTPNIVMQESFAEYDVPWRDDIVFGWNPLRNGEFALPEAPGLGVALNPSVCREHPYKKHTFPSLWDGDWLAKFTQTGNPE